MPDTTDPRAQRDTPATDLIEHAAGIIAAKMRVPHTAPYHWAGALWEAGMLVGPGSMPERDEESAELERATAERDAARRVVDAARTWRKGWLGSATTVLAPNGVRDLIAAVDALDPEEAR